MNTRPKEKLRRLEERAAILRHEISEVETAARVIRRMELLGRFGNKDCLLEQTVNE